MSEEKEINGWIAQYKEQAELVYGTEGYLHYVVGTKEAEIREAFAGRKDWRIRPVKLVFLDDEPTEQGNGK